MWVERSEPETGVINRNYSEVMEMDEMTKEEKPERIGIRTFETAASICGLVKESRRQDRGGG